MRSDSIAVFIQFYHIIVIQLLWTITIYIDNLILSLHLHNVYLEFLIMMISFQIFQSIRKIINLVSNSDSNCVITF